MFRAASSLGRWNLWDIASHANRVVTSASQLRARVSITSRFPIMTLFESGL
jgi:hypothetical protein